MNIEPKHEKQQLSVPLESDYQAVLLRVIRATTQDPAQLRSLVYELARIKLKREAWMSEQPLSRAEARAHMEALEAAIADVEAVTSVDDNAVRALPDHSRGEDGDVTIIEPSRSRRDERIIVVPEARTEDPRHVTLARFLQLLGVAVLAVLIYALAAGRMDFLRGDGEPASIAKSKEDRLAAAAKPAAAPAEPLAAPPPPAPPPPAFPLPSTYGVYALNQDRLFALDALP
ncbi:MAG: hypothetical protein AB7K04_12300, partial [Pseudorhodoplanes sp.]